MKTILLSLFILFGVSSYSQQDSPKRLVHFMQKNPSPANAIPYGANAKAGHYANTGDAKIYYEVNGKGEPFILLHGGGYGSIYEMFQFIDSLSKKYQVIAISTRGHGKSEMGHSPLTYEQKANDVMAVINEITIDSVTILGFSDGAYTGYKVASMYPSRVKKLIAIGAGEQVPGLRQVILDTAEALQLDSVFWKQQLTLMPERQRWQEYWTKIANFYNNMMASKALFQIIQCPVLVMAGERDMNAPLATVIAAYQMIPNSQLGIIPNAPHPVFLVNFPAVWTCMVPFLKK